MGHYYIVFAGESTYLKKWSCRGLQRGFIGLYTIIRYDCGGNKW